MGRGESGNATVQIALTFHLILENSEMSVTIYTLAGAYLREVHSIFSRGSDNMTFQQQNNAIIDIVWSCLILHH